MLDSSPFDRSIDLLIAVQMLEDSTNIYIKKMLLKYITNPTFNLTGTGFHIKERPLPSSLRQSSWINDALFA